MKLLCIVLVFFALLRSSAFADSSVSTNAMELITDHSFTLGLRVTDREKKEHAITWNNGTNAPVWATAQHDSKSCVADTAFQRVRRGGFTFKDDYAWLDFHSPEHDADVVLGLNAFREYDGHYRAPGDPWPHVYLSQHIANPSGHLGDATPSIAKLARLDFSARVRLLYDRRNVTDGYNPRDHASQFLFFLTIQNLNRKSPGYGDYYWFGIACYDDRKPVTTLHAMRDKSSSKKRGTEKFIYDIGVKPFTDKVVADGEWVDVRGDLLPHIVAGLREAWKQDYLSVSTDLADYRVGSVVIGWEIPGLNDAAMALKGLRLTAHLSP